jgi:hypothetical protein
VISLEAQELRARAAKRVEWAWRALTAGAEDLRTTAARLREELTGPAGDEAMLRANLAMTNKFV